MLQIELRVGQRPRLVSAPVRGLPTLPRRFNLRTVLLRFASKSESGVTVPACDDLDSCARTFPVKTAKSKITQRLRIRATQDSRAAKFVLAIEKTRGRLCDCWPSIYLLTSYHSVSSSARPIFFKVTVALPRVSLFSLPRFSDGDR